MPNGRAVNFVVLVKYLNHLKRVSSVTKFFLPLILAAGMHAVSVQAQPKYTVTAICEGYGAGINNNGDVCGSIVEPVNANGVAALHAFLYKKGKVNDLGVYNSGFQSTIFPPEYYTLGKAINSSDFVVGEIYDTRNGFNLIDSFAYLNGKIVPIAGGGDDGGFSSSSAAVNNSGWVVGSYDAGGTVTNPAPYPTSATARAFLYRNGITYDIGTLGGVETQSQAFDINNAGQIVGSSTTAPGDNMPWEAFLYQNGRMQAIGGASSNRFVPSSINDNGWIAGTLFAYPVTFVVPDGGPGEVNGSLNNGTSNYQSSLTAVLYVNGRFTNITKSVNAVSINNNGIVIGYSATGVYVYGNGKTYDLNALVQGNWTITEVGHINDAGQIAVTGIVKGSTNGIPYALLLSPENSSAERP